MNPVLLACLLFFGYMAIIILIGELFLKFLKWSPDIVRKIEHILTAPVWLIMYFTTYLCFETIIISLVGTALLAFITFTPFFKSTSRSDSKISIGVFYFGISCVVITALCFYLAPEHYELVGVIYFTLSLADGFAPLIARLLKKHNPMIREGKSLVGCLTVFIISFLVILVFNIIFKMELTVLFMFAYAAIITGAEYFGYKGLDNLTIVFAGFGFLLLNYFGLSNLAFEIAALSLPIFIILNAFIRSLTDFAILMATIFALTISFCSGMVALITVLSCFFVNAIANKVIKKIRHDTRKSKGRNGWQIFTNSFPAMILCVIAYITKNQLFTIGAMIIVVEEFADSMASDIGRYCPNRPIDIIRFKVIDAGLSGGVSWLGTIIGLAACFTGLSISLAYGIITPLQLVFTSLIAFLGVIIDSILGSLLQVKYRCPVCGKIVDRKEHCDTIAEKASGISFITNSVVNLMTGIILSGISLVFLFFVI